MTRLDGWEEWAEELASETNYGVDEVYLCIETLSPRIGESVIRDLLPKILRLMAGMKTEFTPSSLICGFFAVKKLATAAGELMAAVVDEIRRRPDLSERYSEESTVCQPGTRHTGSGCANGESSERACDLEKGDIRKMENTQKELLRLMKSRVREEGGHERAYTKTEMLEEAARQCVEQGIEPDAIRAGLSRGRDKVPYTKASFEYPVYCAKCGDPKKYHEKYGYICCAPHCSSNTIPAPKTEEPDIKLGEWVCRDCEGPLRKADGVGIYECPCGHVGTIHAVGKRRVE